MDDHEHLARIRLVSRHYHELQGLRGALMGSAFTLAMGGSLFATGWRDAGGSFVLAMVLAFALIIPGMLWLDRYYERTFGRVTPKVQAKRSAAFVIPAIAAVAVVSGRMFDPMHPEAFLFLGAHALWMSIRDWPLRRYQLLVAASGALAAAVQVTETARQAPDSALAAGFLVIGVATMLTGFADHRLLTSSMTLRHTEQGGAAFARKSLQ